MTRKIQSKSLRTLKTFLGILLLLTSSNAWSDDVLPTPSMTFEQRLLSDNIAISDWLVGQAEGLDLFLAGQKLTEKRNETNATFQTQTFYTDLTGLRENTGFNLNLKLPNLEQYWQLKFNSYDDTAERGVRDTYLLETPRPTSYGATLGFFKKLGNIRTSFQPRVNFKATPTISHSLIFESIVEYGSFKFNPKLQFYANADKGTGIFQGIYFNFPLAKRWTLTLINEGDYQDRLHSYTVTHGFSFNQFIDEKTSMGYGFVSGFINQPSYELGGYSFSVSYAQLVYKKILDYQIIPHWDFSSTTDYTGDPGITLNINLNF